MDEPRIEAIGEVVVLPQEGLARFATGTVRGTDADGERWDLITPIGLRRLAQTCAEGARKYGEHNWIKGIPASVMLNHAIRHLYRYLEGDRSEDHLAHAAWNILGVCHFEEAMPEMIDIPPRKRDSHEPKPLGRSVAIRRAGLRGLSLPRRRQAAACAPRLPGRHAGRGANSGLVDPLAGRRRGDCCRRARL